MCGRDFVDEVGSHFFLSHEIVGFDDDSMMCGINGVDGVSRVVCVNGVDGVGRVVCVNGVDGVCGGTNGTTTRTTITSVLFQPINP